MHDIKSHPKQLMYTVYIQYVGQLCLRPSVLESMKTVEGVSDVWLNKYGAHFLSSIHEFCQCSDLNVPMDVRTTPQEPQQKIIKVFHHSFSTSEKTLCLFFQYP